MISGGIRAGTLGLVLLSALAAVVVRAGTPLALLQELDAYPHARSIDFSQREVLDYEIGLGAMQKVGGAWRFKQSARFSGTLTSYTWQIVDGFTSLEVMDELVDRVAALAGSELVFSCASRACGQSVQWANRVFHQRLLYGREELQHYEVYRLSSPAAMLLVYAAARTADRQYLHAELLSLASPE